MYEPYAYACAFHKIFCCGIMVVYVIIITITIHRSKIRSI